MLFRGGWSSLKGILILAPVRCVFVVYVGVRFVGGCVGECLG